MQEAPIEITFDNSYVDSAERFKYLGGTSAGDPADLCWRKCATQFLNLVGSIVHGREDGVDFRHGRRSRQLVVKLGIDPECIPHKLGQGSECGSTRRQHRRLERPRNRERWIRPVAAKVVIVPVLAEGFRY